MPERLESAKGPPPLTQRERKQAIASWEAQRKHEVEAGLAVLHARRAEEQRTRLKKRIKELWPVWLGMVLGLLGPEIEYVAASIGPWCVTLIYPFVVLARRPEIQVGFITHLLPSLMLYIQFPIEGWLAHIILKRHVHPLGVAWEVLLFHFLGLMELWMLSGGAHVFVAH